MIMLMEAEQQSNCLEEGKQIQVYHFNEFMNKNVICSEWLSD